MKTLIKSLLILIVVGIVLGAGKLWLNTVTYGNYFNNAGPFLGLLVGIIAPIALVGGAGWLIIKIARFDVKKYFSAVLIAIPILGITGCGRATSNNQVLVTHDCGSTWKLVQTGERIPAMVGPCAYKVTVPAYPMQGQTQFKTSFKNRVLATIEVNYEYSITDAKAFINEAKYLGKVNTDGDDAANAASAYESAENSVIDKRIRDIASEFLLIEDIVDFSQAQFEDQLLLKVNENLKARGVQLNFLSFVPTPEEQTRLAIDMMTAMKVYESRNLSDLGQKVAVARAGASKIEVGVPPTPASK